MAPKKKPFNKLSKTAKYYRTHKDSAEKKKKTDNKVNDRPEQKKKRRESERKRYKARKKGKNIENKDYDHKSGRFISYKKNRGRKGEGNR